MLNHFCNAYLFQITNKKVSSGKKIKNFKVQVMLNDSLDMIYSGTCATFSVFGREMSSDAKDHRRNSKDKTIKQSYQEE